MDGGWGGGDGWWDVGVGKDVWVAGERWWVQARDGG